MNRRLVITMVVILTVVTAWLSTRLRIDADLTALFPDDPRSRALAQYAHVFGGGDMSLLLVSGEDPVEIEHATHDAAASLAEGRGDGAIADVIERVSIPEPPDPTLAWAYAGPRARDALDHAVSNVGIHARLHETHALLLAPGTEAIEPLLAKDPLRLAAIPFAGVDVAAGLHPSGDGAFVTEDGRARLVMILPRGNAFESDAASRFVSDVDARLEKVKSAHPLVAFEIAGGHSIAKQTEALIRRDFETSGVVSLVLAMIAFVAFFRRPRALVAVIPPLLLGTLWIVGLAALLVGHLSAIGVAFMAVVVGVGVDTGVHVYAAFLDARAAGHAGADAAHVARKVAARPTLLAALIAASAFAALALSSLVALKQLGLLCAAGELATAVAILIVTPEIAIHLERSRKPNEPWRAKKSSPVGKLTSTRGRAIAVVMIAIIVCIFATKFGTPRLGSALVAIHPRIEALDVYEKIHARFGGGGDQWIILTRDASEEHARERADVIAENLDELAKFGGVDGFDSLSTIAPSRKTIENRLKYRDSLILPDRAKDLESALRDEGFDPTACAQALDAFREPRASTEVVPPPAWIVARHEAKVDGDTLIATYVRPSERTSPALLTSLLAGADPGSVLTGYSFLETQLKDDLAHDLPRVLAAAFLAVVIGLFATLRRARAAGIALAALVCETATVLLITRALGVTWHIYDALVVPVLLGVTLDEVLFVLHAESVAENAKTKTDAILAAIDAQGRLVATTAMTSAAGFAALAFCKFEGLRDLGIVGAAGSATGLLCALFVVPACLRVLSRDRREK